MNYPLKKTVIIVCLLLSGGTSAGAAEISTDIALGHWQYKEHAAATSGFAITPLNSDASGMAVSGGITISQSLAQQWQLQLFAKGMQSLDKSTERWSLATGWQRNTLELSEMTTGAALLRDFNLLHAGIRLAYQNQNQRRSAFVSNGVPIAGAVVETVNVLWTGIALKAENSDNRLRSSLYAGVPAWVHVTNTAIPGAVFDTRSGIRAELDIAWALPRQPARFELLLNASYRYQELGNQVTPSATGNALWPKNRLSLVTAGMTFNW